jgi:4-carboxymuconolactone decarboxylase
MIGPGGAPLETTVSVYEILASLARDDGSGVSAMPCALDTRSMALVRLAVIVAMDAPAPSFRSVVSTALQAGATVDEVVGVLIGVAPAVGVARVSSAAPKLARAIGIDVDIALEELDEGFS